MAQPDRALHRAFPALDGIPRVDLGTFPTPIEPLDLTSVVPSFRGRAWVKREDRSAHDVGGNKVRKLEFHFGHALELGRRSVLTLGGVGSNHCLATAHHAPTAGLDVEVVIFPHDVTPTSRRTLNAICSCGPRITYAPTDAASVPVTLARYIASTARGARPYLMGPGGTSVRGNLGWVEAGLEIGEQVSRGELEAPDVVFCAYSSGGTASGMALGLQLAGLRSYVYAVRVYPPPLTSEGRISRGAERVARWIAATAKSELPPFDRSRIRVPGEYLGDGYAVVTAQGAAAREAAAGLGLALDPTYTAKAFAAFLEAAGTTHRDARLLFLSSYDDRKPAGVCDPERVPAHLRAYL